MINLLCTSSLITTYTALWPTLLIATVAMTSTANSAVVDEDGLEELEEAGYQPSFARLSAATSGAAVVAFNFDSALKEGLRVLSAKMPGHGAMIQEAYVVAYAGREVDARAGLNC